MQAVTKPFIRALFVLLFATASQAGAPLPLRLLLTSDLHMQLLNHDLLADRPVSDYGLVRTATRIREAQAEQPNHLLFDNGDLLQGGPLGDWLALNPPARHPAYAAFERLGYTAANLGNHDFDFGLPFLRKAIAGTRLSVMNANLLDARTGKPAFRPTLLLERRLRDRDGRLQRLRIGVLGLAPPQTLLWNGAVLGQRLRARGFLETAAEWVPRLRAQGADIVVVIAHTGIGRNAENAGLLLAELPGVDALLLGHAHAEFPGKAGEGLPGVDAAAGTLNGVPAVMPGRWGDHLGVIDLELRREAGRWRVAEARSSLRPTRGTAADPALAAWLQPLAQPVRAWVNAPLAETRQPLHAHFAQWQPSRLVQWVQQAQAEWVRPRLAGSPWAELPLLSAAAPLRTATSARPDGATDIPAGPLRLRHLADIYPYPNRVQVLRIRGGELRAWLERSAAQFLPIAATGPAVQPLLDPRFPGYNFDQIDGMSWLIDPSLPLGQRVLNLQHAGQAVLDDAEFLLVTNSYRTGGGGGFPALPAERLVLDLPDENRETLAAYLRQHPVLDAPLAGGWRLQLPPGVQAALPLPAAARPHLGELTGSWQLREDAALPLLWKP